MEKRVTKTSRTAPEEGAPTLLQVGQTLDIIITIMIYHHPHHITMGYVAAGMHGYTLLLRM